MIKWPDKNNRTKQSARMDVKEKADLMASF